jgi:hypothetical protein
MEPRTPYATFIVRVFRDDTGRLAGIVERVRTGERARFRTAGGIGRLVERMVQGDPPAETRWKRPEPE